MAHRVNQVNKEKTVNMEDWDFVGQLVPQV